MIKQDVCISVADTANWCKIVLSWCMCRVSHYFVAISIVMFDTRLLYCMKLVLRSMMTKLTGVLCTCFVVYILSTWGIFPELPVYIWIMYSLVGILCLSFAVTVVVNKCKTGHCHYPRTLDISFLQQFFDAVDLIAAISQWFPGNSYKLRLPLTDWDDYTAVTLY